MGGETIPLTVTEFSILELLVRRPGWAFNLQEIIDGIRDYNYVITPHAMDVQVFGLRKKLGKAGRHIKTVRGIGYKTKG